MGTDKFFWDAVMVLMAAAAGVGGKIFYDMLRYKAPPREGGDIKKFSETYDPDVCALRHNTLDKEITSLSAQDSATLTCINHVKTLVHGLEIITTEHRQKLESDDRRIIALENTAREVKKDYSEIRKDYSKIQTSLETLLNR